MSSREDFLYWKIVQSYIVDKKYHLLNLSDDQYEMWIENLSERKFPIIRIKRVDVDWSNLLRRDIEFILFNGEVIRKKFYKRSLNVLNIYVSPFPPVDSHDDIIDKMVQSKNQKVGVYSIIASSSKFDNSSESLKNIGIENTTYDLKESYEPYEIETIKDDTLHYAVTAANREKEVLEYGKPFFTYFFLAIQIIVFFLMELSGGSTNIYVLLQFGAKVNPLILQGEWWRFFTPIFLHIGFFHLFMNSLALYYLGTAVEKIYGKLRFLVIYLVAGFFGSLASFIFSPNLSAGASGAIFGCFGALLYFGLVNRKAFFRTMGMNILTLIAFNLILGFIIPGIDNAGHIGGLVGGFLATGIVHLPKNYKFSRQSIFLIGTILLTVAGLFYGFLFPNV